MKTLNLIVGALLGACIMMVMMSPGYNPDYKAAKAGPVSHTGDIWTAGNAKYEVTENSNPDADDCRFILQSADGVQLLAGPDRIVVEMVAEAMCESVGNKVDLSKGSDRFSDTTHRFFVGPAHGRGSARNWWTKLFVPGAPYASAIEKYWLRRELDAQKSRSEKDPEIRIVRDGDRWWVGSMALSYDVDGIYPKGYSLIVQDGNPRSIAASDSQKAMRQLAEIEACYYTYGAVDKLATDSAKFESRLKGPTKLLVSTSEVPGKDFIVAPAPADAINLARHAQWYWALSRATQLPE